MNTLDTAALRTFLSEGTRTGTLGFTAADGRPLVTPVWFLVAGHGPDAHLVFTTGIDSAKGRALRRDPRLALCVDREEPPFAFVQVQGHVTLDDDPGALLETTTAVAARYMGPERAEEFGRRNAAPDAVVVRLHPTRIVTSVEEKSELSEEEN